MTAMDTGREARIVVGVDGSEDSIKALQWAAELAPLLDCEIEAVVAWSDPRQSGWSPGWGYLTGDLDPGGDAEKILGTALDEAFGNSRPPRLRSVTEKGSAAKVLLDRSSGARMLVVGSRGHGGFAGLLLGSVSSKCAEHAKCPTLVIHE
jgi:nucleotide-binding universal stress UspA family protein